MTLVKRYPFARTEIHRKLYSKDHECKWCGQKGRVFEFRNESDGGRVTEYSGVFCSNSCFKAYHN